MHKPKPQKFHRGDRVRIGKMPSYMSHFSGECDAIVLGSYRDDYPYLARGDERSKHIYGVYLLPNRGYTSWYEENQLTSIKGPHGLKLADKLEGTEFVKP